MVPDRAKPKTMMRNFILLLLSVFVVVLVGCARLGVPPYQREVLAKEEMRPVADPLTQDYDDHIYFSKEASSGGGTFAGGGCGCN